MGASTFSGPITSTAGFIQGTGVVATAITASTLTVDSTYNGMVVPLSRAAGITVTLPASSGGQAVYRFFIPVALSSNSHIIKVANATDVMNGFASIGGGTAALFGTLPASDTITMNATTTGGLAGSFVEVYDVALGFWITRAHLVGSGTPATCFSATV